ncbi:hypothetical protein EAY39_12620 [Vibrio anguillarum]|uniref:hypothetical protein n=1 Tax=Vibrio anguillarum TaxID=55601 RepID=UPI000BB4954B|nr:hypothetical protein [Vibrio anguillarum]ATC60114.1 hypothetical protein CMV05_22175 [Vibrio anguillarum]MBF4252590.1 hypothetical protein [Vibrio anguillarum]MBF4341609.1 hypothetical protein [Vibrio anguillarum]
MAWVSLVDYCKLYDFSESEVFDMYSAGAIQCRFTNSGFLIQLPKSHDSSNASSFGSKFLSIVSSTIGMICDTPSSDESEEPLMYDDGFSDKRYTDAFGLSYKRDMKGDLRDDFGRRPKR